MHYTAPAVAGRRAPLGSVSSKANPGQYPRVAFNLPGPLVCSCVMTARPLTTPMFLKVAG